MPLKIWFGDKEVTNRVLLEGGIFNRGVSLIGGLEMFQNRWGLDEKGMEER